MLLHVTFFNILNNFTLIYIIRCQIYYHLINLTITTVTIRTKYNSYEQFIYIMPGFCSQIFIPRFGFYILLTRCFVWQKLRDVEKIDTVIRKSNRVKLQKLFILMLKLSIKILPQFFFSLLRFSDFELFIFPLRLTGNWFKRKVRLKPEIWFPFWNIANMQSTQLSDSYLRRKLFIYFQ